MEVEEACDSNGEATEACVLWRVEDTGIGIAPGDQAAIFDEFRQVDGSATRRFGGAGLGLALSQGLANRLGGEIRLRSVPGEGSVFTLAVPALEGARSFASTIAGGES